MLTRYMESVISSRFRSQTAKSARRETVRTDGNAHWPGLEVTALISLVTLKKIVPHLVQLGDCRLEWWDEQPFAFTSHESKAIESLERVGNFEINVDYEIFRKPRLDTTCNLGHRWRYLRLADEVICERRFLGLLILGSSDQVVKNARIIVDIAEVHVFSEFHMVLQRLMLIFQPLAHGKATERHDPHQGGECRFHVGVCNRPGSAEVNSRHKEQDGNRGVEFDQDRNTAGNRWYAEKGLVKIAHDDARIGEKGVEIATRDIAEIFQQHRAWNDLATLQDAQFAP